jgi:uncharacterized protein (DUF433 family)
METKSSTINSSTVTREQVVDLIQTIPPERLQSVYDYALFLKTRPLPSPEEQRYREIEEYVSELERLRETTTVEYHVGIEEGQPTVVRNRFGLSIGGTRLTLYDIMDYVTGGWSPSQIQRWFRFSDQQINDIMEYIETHREVVEAEYQQVLEQAERNRIYWTERNKDLLAQTEERIQTAQGPVWDKLRAQRAKLNAQ